MGVASLPEIKSQGLCLVQLYVCKIQAINEVPQWVLTISAENFLKSFFYQGEIMVAM